MVYISVLYLPVYLFPVFNVFAPNIAIAHCINNGLIFMLRVSKQPYKSVQHDRIFESGASASLVAKKEIKY